jgi:flagellar biosynthetic protein FliR
MPTEISFDTRGILVFLLALARVSGVIAFVPFPGLKTGPDLGRASFAMLLTWCLRPVWPSAPQGAFPGPLTLAFWILAEAAFGITLGLMTGFLIEAFQFGAQAIATQAGYSYASSIDPNTQADSGVIPVIIQLMSGICFFIAGIDREILRALAWSFEHIPPGGFQINMRTATAVIETGGAMLSAGIRIALPVIAFLLLVDLALALLGRMQSQLQLLTLAFPVKMLASLLLLASLASLFPTVFQSAAQRALDHLQRVLGG